MSIEIDSLEIKVQASATDSSAGIDTLTAAFRNLKAITKGGVGLTTVANQLSKLNTALSGVNIKGVSSLNYLGKGLKNLYGLENIKISSSIGNQIGAIVDAADKVDTSFEVKMQSITNGLAPLSQLGKANMTSFINQLKKLPAVISELDKADLDKFATQMERAASAIRPLATEMQKVSNGFSAFPIRIQKIISANTGLTASNYETSESFGVMGTGISSAKAKLGIYYMAFKRIANMASDWVKESNDYVENLNLFNVAMGDAAESAKAYAGEVRNAIGIDPSEWMRNQGVLKQISSGFGVVESKANLMSKNLTQIGYDISSFFNISIEDSMQKVQSGIAGELEPLRRLGYALDVATLQEIAYKNGIDMKVNSMTQAQKSQLRYLAIMEQSGNVIGDMARTVQTPANAMRILNQQITQLCRAFGNLLIPFLQMVIPYMQAFVELLTEAINALASMVGFELPKIDYSGLDGVAGGAEEAEDALGGASKAAKELKNATLGIDELNILPDQSASGGGSGGAGGDLGLDLPEYDFLGGFADKTNEIKEQLKDALVPIAGIAAGFAAWKIAKSTMGWFDDLKKGKFKSIKELASGINKTAIGLSLMVAGFVIEAGGAFDMGYNGPNLKNVIQTAIGSALGIAGSLLVFGTGPVGWTIGILAALTIGVSSFVLGYNKRQMEDEIKRRFGEITLSAEEIAAQAKIIMTTPLTVQLDAYVETKNSADAAIDEYISNMNSFRTLAYKMSVGIGIDQEQLIDSANAALLSAQAAIDAQKETYTLAIDIGMKDGDVKTDMALFADSYFSSAQSELDRLGKEMHDAIINGLSDGELGPEDMEAIANLQNEMNQIVQKMADAKYKAKLSAITMDAGGSLTYETAKEMMNELQSVASERIEQLEGIRIDNLTLAELKFQEDGNKAAYDAAVAEIQRTFLEQSAEIEMGAATWGLDQFKQSFSDAVEESQEAFDIPMQNLITGTFRQFETDETGVLVEGQITDFMNSVRELWGYQFDSLDVTPEAKAALKEALGALEPDAEALKKIADDAKAAGQKVPEYIAKGLQDYNLLAAVTGNVEAIDYLMGAKLSTDPAFLEALAKAEGAGKELNKSVSAGLVNNLPLVTDETTGLVIGIKDTVNGGLLEWTPELVQNMKDLGINLADGVLSGSETQMKHNIKKLETLCGVPLSVMRKVNDINSPSKKFAEIGGYLSDGLLEGINGKKNGLYGSIRNWADGVIRTVEKKFEIHSPSRVFRDEIGVNLGLGIAEGLNDSAGSVIHAADELMGGIQKSFGEVGIPVTAEYAGNGGFANINEMEAMISLTANGSSPGGSDQIADSVRTGMAEQNALLRRQNEILIELLERGGHVYLDSREITERQGEVNRMYGR